MVGVISPDTRKQRYNLDGCHNINFLIWIHAIFKTFIFLDRNFFYRSLKSYIVLTDILNFFIHSPSSTCSFLFAFHSYPHHNIPLLPLPPVALTNPRPLLRRSTGKIKLGKFRNFIAFLQILIGLAYRMGKT